MSRSFLEPPPVGLLSAPLDGMTATGTAGLAGSRTVHHHLAALGAHPRVESAASPTTGPDAGHLVGTTGGGPVDVRFGLDWGIQPAGADIVQAVCGVAAVHGRRDGSPRLLGLDVVSPAAGVLTVCGVLAAAIAQLRDRRISGVEVAVAQAALLLVGQHLAVATTPVSPGDEDVADAHPGTAPPFHSSDGTAFELDTLDVQSWQEFWQALDAEPHDVRRGWRPFMLRYATAVCPLPPGLHACLARHSFIDIVSAANQAGMSILVVRSAAAWAADRDRSGYPPEPWRLSTFSSAPGSDVPWKAAPQPAGAAPLSGFTVVESTRRVQGPMAGKILAMLGAHVVRVEPPGGDPLRGMPPTVGGYSSRFQALNRGKDIVEINIKTPSGRREVMDLIAGADVFLHNWAPGKAAQLGLDSDDMARVNPMLVYAYASGWGDLFTTPTPIGTDFMVQAYTGLGELVETGPEPRPSLMAIVDTTGGLVAAEGALAGLLSRERTGRGHRVDSSLLSAATVLQQSAHHTRPADPAASGRIFPLRHPVPTASGSLYCRIIDHDDWTALTRALGVGHGAEPADAEAEVLARLRTEPAEQWVDRLTAAGLACAVAHDDLLDVGNNASVRPYLVYDQCAFVRSPWRFQ